MTSAARPSATFALSSYLPKVLLDRLAKPAPISEPEMSRTAGAILISDVDGFTALVERFGKRGREGLEELTWTLNDYVTDLVEIVYSAGGDVLSIAGDALLCHWPAASAAPAHVSEATLRATRAGFAIQRLLRERGQASDTRFETRIGIGVGEVAIGFVGGLAGRWELVVGGSAFRDAAAAERRARANEVLLAEQAWAPIASDCVVVKTDDGFVSVIDPGEINELESRSATLVLDDAVLQPYLPTSVQDRLSQARTGGLKWLAESRRLSVLMTELASLDGGDADGLARTHAAVRAFQSVVQRCEGAAKVDVDEKGVLLLAAFGLPPRAHENDAERAAHAARLLADEFARLNVRAGIGIATGRAFCGAFGSDRRRDYMIRGDVINLAARLMRAAEGSVCCDGDTVEAVRGRMAFETLDAVTVKGRSAPVQLYRPLARRGSSFAPSSDVVGRESERALLAMEIERVRAGAGGVVILEADAGLGKSQLLAHAVRGAAASDVAVLTAAADAIERRTPYYAWRQTFAAIFGVVEEMPAAALRERIEQRMAALPAWQRLTPLLSDVLPVRLDDNALTVEMEAEVRAENTKQLLSALLREASVSAPTMLAVEDAHWLDSASWALLLEVVRAVPTMLLVITTRPFGDAEPDDFVKLAAAAGDRRLRLENLSPSDLEILIGRQLHVTDVPASLANFIYERVNGHPFFCEELLRAMTDVGAIRVEDGQCITGDLGAFDLPTTIEGVIVSRLDRLTPNQQLCLKVASVIGRIFRARVLEDTHPVAAERGAVRDRLRELSTLQLTALESVEPELAYLFKHVITRDVTYDMMPLAHRQPLHRAVAQWYEQQYAVDLSPHYGLLAYHWARAANPVKTVEYLEKAGQQALHTGAFREVVLLLSQAVEMMQSGAVPVDGPRRALWEKNLGIASYFLGDMAGSRTHLGHALGELHRPVPATRAGAVGSALAAVGRQLTHRVAPRRFLGRRQAEKASLDEAVECYKTLGQALYMEGVGPEWLLYATTNGLNLGEEAGGSAPLARVMINASMLAYLIGLRGESERYAKRAIAMAESEGQYGAAAYVWHIHSLTLAQQAAWQPLKEASAKALALAQELGDVGLEGEIWLVRSTVAHCEGDFNNAPAAWTRMREAADRAGNATRRCWSLLDEVETRLARGETEEAVRALDEALRIPTPDSDVSMQLEKHRAIAGTRLREGAESAAEAVASADAIVDLLKRYPPTGYHMADHLAAAVDVYLAVLRDRALARRVDAARVARRAMRGGKQLARLGRTFVHVQPRVHLVRGALSVYRDDPAGARRHFLAAELRAQSLLMPVEQGRALAERAALRDGRDSDPGALLAAACELFARAGATYWFERTAP